MAKSTRFLTDEERKEKQRIAHKKWEASHPHARRDYQRQYMAAHPELAAKKNKQAKAWREANKERFRAKAREWAKANPDKIKESARKYRTSNREAAKRASQKWLKEHPEKRREYDQRNWEKHRDHINARARELYHANLHESRLLCLKDKQRRRNVPGCHTTAQWLARVEYYGWRCRYCRIPLSDETLRKDHVIPVSKGGTDWPSNLVPACGHCNSRKSTKRHFTPAVVHS